MSRPNNGPSNYGSGQQSYQSGGNQSGPPRQSNQPITVSSSGARPGQSGQGQQSNQGYQSQSQYQQSNQGYQGQPQYQQSNQGQSQYRPPNQGQPQYQSSNQGQSQYRPPNQGQPQYQQPNQGQPQYQLSNQGQPQYQGQQQASAGTTPRTTPQSQAPSTAAAPVQPAAAPTGNRHGSFSGIRDNVPVTFFVDGEDYFDAVATAIDQAKETIFIEDWWLSPQLLLRRPFVGEKFWRIDELLTRKASEGVQVRIVIYKEFKLALALDSRYVKEWMNKLHPNIIVQRHPDHEGDNAVLFWAHHEKMVIVDSKIAFCGGLDLCFGRFDNNAHRMADPTSIMWPGQDYNNPRRKDFVNVSNYKQTLIDREIFPRMPWHDVSLRVTGLAAYDIARHFVERWNFIKREKAGNKPEIPMIELSIKNAQDYSESVRGTCRTQVVRSSAKWSSGVPHELSIQTAYIDMIAKAEHFIYIENQFFISSPIDGKDVISNKVANALVKRIMRAYSEGKPFRVIVAMPLMPAFEADVDEKGASTLRLVMHYQYTTICRGGNSIFEQLIAKGIRPSDYIGFYSLRQYDLIRDSKYYPKPSKEEAAKMKEIEAEDDMLEAERKETHFSAHLPSFITNFFKKETQTVKAEGSALAEAKFDLEQDSQYVSEILYIHTKLMIVDDRYVICGSANINDRSMCGDRDSEIAMIVEDRDLVDSKMNGKPYKAARTALDLRIKIFSEHLGLTPDLCMRNLHHLPPHQRLRHLQDSDPRMKHIREILQDPLSSEFNSMWAGVAKRNTTIYRDLFHCVPDDTVTNWEEYKKFAVDKTKVTPGQVVDTSLTKSQILERLHGVQGHLVEFPTLFLRSEELKASRFTAERLMPEDVFT